MHYASLAELSKKNLWQTIYNNNYTQKCSKFLQWKICKVFNVWHKKIQRRYLSWHWRVTQNLKKNWLVLWKITWGIWQIFTRAIESLKVGILMGSSVGKYELKIHRGVMFHDNEEWCKIWRGTDLSFQNWHEEFDEFWPDHSKVSKVSILICSFWAKYILLVLKKYRGVTFHETEEGYKIWRGIDLLFQNWRKEFDRF